MYSNTIILNYVIETDMSIDDTISSHCIMDDMPMRIKLSIDSVINIYSELAALIIKSIGSMSDIQIKIQAETPCANTISTAKFGSDFSVKVITDVSLKTLKFAEMDDTSISIVTDKVNAAAGYYRTIDDVSQYTMNDVGGFTLRELYFAEMR